MGSHNYYKMFGLCYRKFKVKESGPPSDVVEAFSAYTEGRSYMSAGQFRRFLVEFQGEVQFTLEMSEQLMRQVLHQRHHLTKYTRHHLKLDDFFFFLFHDDLNSPINLQVHHDMTAPLQHYFIYTGHNSYLTGNQLSSDSSDIPIINALERGVRGIELDLWPNSTNDAIHVTHGRTLTTPVTLEKCLMSIKQHAFVASSYPVIITLEDHLTPSLRAKVAEMAVEIFGELLYRPEPACYNVLPSPEALKHQIILSTKVPKECTESMNINDNENELSAEELSGEDLSEMETPKLADDLQTDRWKSYSNLGDEEHGSDRHRSSQQDGAMYKHLFSYKSADRKVEPPNNLAGLTSIHNRNFIHSVAPDECSKDPRFDGNSFNLYPPVEHPKYPNLGIQSSSQFEKFDEHPEDQILYDSKSRSLGTPYYKHMAALQTTDDKDAEDLDVYPNRSNQFGTIKIKCLGSPLREFKHEYDNEADGDEDVSKFQNTESAYKRLIGIHAEKPKGGLRRALLVEANKVKRISLSELELERAVECYATDVVRFTQKHIVRVYPKGTRVTSSNYDPVKGWLVGAQMVAFNMQGYDKNLWLMHGMFRGNGGCGYVKKPEILMKTAPHEIFHPQKTLPVKTALKVKVYMGEGWHLDFSRTHFDTYSPPDFYTKIYIVGAPEDYVKIRTKIIDDDWTPTWDAEIVFPLRVPELALLRIEVRDYDMSEKDDFGGQTCLPVSELRPGIRAVPLYDDKGTKYKSVKLLMRFQFEENNSFLYS